MMTGFFPCLILAAFATQPAVSPNPNPSVPLAAVLRFKAEGPVATSVDVSDGKNKWTLTYGPEHSPEKGLPVFGMRPGRKHEIRVSIRDGKGKANAPEALTYTTPPLPKDEHEMPPMKVTVRKKAKMEPGYALFSPRRDGRALGPAFATGYGMLLMLDDEGEVVWYFRTNSRISDLQRLRNGNFAFVTQDFRAVEINMLGDVVAQWYAGKRPQGPVKGAIAIDTLTFHHELDELPNGNFLILGTELRDVKDYYTSETDSKAPRKTQPVMGDEVIEFTREGKEVWRWRAFDSLDPYRLAYETFDGYWTRRGFPNVQADFSHANGVLYDPGDDSVIVNLRMQSMVVKVDRKTKEIRWVLGDPKGMKPELAKKALRLEPQGAEWHYFQHAPSPTPWGTLLLFNNSNYKAWPFDPPVPPGDTWSRAIEYKIDEKKRVARLVWESEPKPAYEEWASAIAMGDVDPLPKTKNVLAHYGMLQARVDAFRKDRYANANATPWSRIREFTRDRKAELVWELIVGDPSGNAKVGWSIYGGERLPGLQ